METKSSATTNWTGIILGFFILSGLYLTSLYNYLLFHSITETFIIVVACVIFILVWNSRKSLDNNYLFLIGIAYFFIAVLELIHTLSYPGMGIFKEYDTNLPTQLWIAARYMESLSLLIAPLLFGRRIKLSLLFMAYAFATCLIFLSIFIWNIFPACFIEGSGLTPFKKISEYIICLFFLGAITFLYQNRKEFKQSVYRLLVASIVLSIASELSFTFYIHAYSLSNLAGHYFTILSFYLIYKAIIEIGFIKPYDLLFRNLKQSEEKFKTIFLTSPNAITLTSVKDGIYTDISDGFTKMLGHTREEVVGKSSVELNIWNNIKDRELLLSGLKQYGFVENLEAEFKKKDGQIRIGLMSAHLLDIDNKKTILAVTQDITEKKQAENALETSGKEMESIFRAAPTGIGVVCDRIIQQVNDRLCEMVGYSKNELTGQSARMLYSTDKEYEYVGKEKYRQISAKGTGTVETKFQCRDGKIIDILLSSTPIDLNNLSKGVTFTALDITYLKNKESELLESEEKYRSMMEAMDEPVTICTEDYKISYMNPAMIRRTGYDAIGENCFKAIHGLEEKCPWCRIDKTRQGISFKTDIVSPKDDRYYHISNVPIINKNGSVAKMTIFRDITNFKKLESQLQQAQKMESIGTLAGGIAHDFNNILFPIVGHTEMLLEDIPEGSPFRMNLTEIYTGALRARDLVKQILTFSRQNNSELKLMRMQPIIKEALKLIRSSIPTTIDIKQDIQTQCGVIIADPTQIHQIIMNLTTNAYHAMEDNGGEIEVSLKEVEIGALDLINPDMHPGLYARLSIADTGVGIDKKIADKIFDPFFTTKEQGKGTGMGLSVVHGIVISMNGAIKVISESGKGTKFHIYFPIEKSPSDKQPSEPKTKIQGGTEHILLIDDEEAILKMEKLMLERLGYHITSHTNSIKALETFRDNPDKFDMVITDMAMPNMAGDKLSVELTKICPGIPVILCTGFSEIISEEKAASLGIKGFLLKPIVMSDLSMKIREVLDKN